MSVFGMSAVLSPLTPRPFACCDKREVLVFAICADSNVPAFAGPPLHFGRILVQYPLDSFALGSNTVLHVVGYL